MALHVVSTSAAKVFCVPGAGATITCFMPLANAFGSSASVFGFQPRGLDGAMPPYTSVARAATVYVAAMREMQRKGPYRLIGHSFGGWIAFEMAGLLLAAGEEVMPVILLDSDPPSLERTLARHYSRVGTILKLAHILEVSTGKRMSLSRDDLESRDARSQNAVLAERMRHIGLLPRTAKEDAVCGLLRVLSANLNAAYVPSNRVDVPVQLIRALEATDSERDVENLEIERENRSSRWEDHAADLRILDMPGNHMTMLSHPHVDAIVEHVRHLWGEGARRAPIGSAYSLGITHCDG
jgi:thioesterase domain-containing protein